MMRLTQSKSLFFILFTILLSSFINIQEPVLYLNDGDYRLIVELEGLKMEIQDGIGAVKVPKDQESGLLLNGHPVIST